jgi:hypothetical protein
MKGTIMALESIAIQTGATQQGRALARTAAVTLDGNAVSVPLTNAPGPGFIISTNVFVTAISPITHNRQTGLSEQTVHLNNNGSTDVPAVRLLIQALPPDVQVYNGSGSVNGTPYVQHNFTLAADSGVDLLIEYYRASRRTIPQPSFSVQESTPAPVTETGPIIALDPKVQPPLADGRFLLDFSATPGRRYAVQYTSDMVTWKTATPVITAPANRVQWYDDGPPKTESRPDSEGTRIYRVMQLP